MTVKTVVFTRESLKDSRLHRNQSYQKIIASRSTSNPEINHALAAFLYAVCTQNQKERDADDK